MIFQKNQTLQLELPLGDSCSLPQFIHVRQDRNTVIPVLMWKSLHLCPNPAYPYCLTSNGVNFRLSQLHLLNFNQTDEVFSTCWYAFWKKVIPVPCQVWTVDLFKSAQIGVRQKHCVRFLLVYVGTGGVWMCSFGDF